MITAIRFTLGLLVLFLTNAILVLAGRFSIIQLVHFDELLLARMARRHDLSRPRVDGHYTLSSCRCFFSHRCHYYYF